MLLSHVQKLSHVRLCKSMDCSMPGFPVLHHPPKLAQTHIPLSWCCHSWSHPLSSPFSSCLQSFPESGSLTMNCFFALSGQSNGASVSVLPMNIQDWFLLGWTGWISLQSKGLSKESSPTPQLESINSLVLSLLYGPTLTSVHGYWKNHSFDRLLLEKWCLCFLICCLGLS